MYFIVLPVVVPFNINIIIIIIIIFLLFFFFPRYMRYVFTIGLLDLVIIQATSSLSRMAPLVAFRCSLITHDNYCSLLYVAENKLVVVVV